MSAKKNETTYEKQANSPALTDGVVICGLCREKCDYISNLLSSAHERNRTQITQTRLPRKNNNNNVVIEKGLMTLFLAYENRVL